MIHDLVIANATLVTATAVFDADIAVSDEHIVEVGHGLLGRRQIDATGKLALPGGVDPHVHLDMDAGAFCSSDDFETGTVSAACGGTTTVIDFVEPEPGGSLLAGLHDRLRQAEGRAVIDFGLHMTLRQGDVQTLQQVPDALRAGCLSFKAYTTYEGFRLNDEALLAAFDAVGAAGGLMLVHAENDAIVRRAQAKHLAAGQSEPRYHPSSRPVQAEVEAVERALMLADVAGCPVYIVHTSTGLAAEAIARARARGQAAFGETCPQYLVLTEAEYERPGFEGAKYVCSPPLRSADNVSALWHALSGGQLQTVGTDHCPFNYAGQKEAGWTDFTQIPNGLPGIEARLALLYTFGVRAGRLSLNRWVETCCTAPARLMGLYPQKGALTPGSDGDLVVFDPEREVMLSPEFLQERVDYTPYAGMRVRGYPEFTVVRGKVVVEGGEFVGERGRGRFLRRTHR
jgi:dihydropyrimidinase